MPLRLPKTPRIPGKQIELRNSGWASRAYDAAWSDDGFYTFSYLRKGADRNGFDHTRHQSEANGTARCWAIFAVADSAIVGLAEAHVVDADDLMLEFGYWIAKEYRCKGFATEALKLLTQWADTCPAPVRVELPIHPENHASIKVAKNTGYIHRGKVVANRPIGGLDIVDLYTWTRDVD